MSVQSTEYGEGDSECEDEDECVWQSISGRCLVVLGEVFRWLSAREVSAAGGVCRAWRAAALEPALWRRRLRLAPHTTRALHRLGYGGAWWRSEYVLCCAGWRLRARLDAGAPLLCAALSRGGTLATGAQDAALTLWRRDAAGAWRAGLRRSLRALGWAAVSRVCWAPCERRLLLAGPLALVDHAELLVLTLADDEEYSSISCRVRCSAGAGGCWADEGDTFLSLQLRRLGPALYCTTVWLNTATQETQSEYAGVTAPLLTIYNEDGAHITHALVAQTCSEDSTLRDVDEEEGAEGPGTAYFRATLEEAWGAETGAERVVVAAAGEALGTWRVCRPRPPPVLARAAGGLAQRVRERRAAAAQPPPAPPDPDEAAVRAACTPPLHRRRLAATVIGLVLHPRGRCVWVCCGDGGVVCVSLSLVVLCRVPAPQPAGPRAAAHLVQPAVSDHLLAWPAGGYSGRVWSVGAVSCARPERAAPHAASHAAPAVSAALPALTPHAAPQLLVAAGDHLYVWESRATVQPHL